jgi:RecA-family ATPase
MSVAMGRPFLGKFPVQQGPVLFVAGEDDDGMLLTRLYAICAAKRQPADYIEAMRQGLARHTAAELAAAPDVEWIPYPHLPLPEDIHLHTEGGFRFGDDAREAALLAAARQLRPRLIVLDPFKDMVPAS